jgi:hypothetical protein
MAYTAADVQRWVRSARPSARQLGEQLCTAVSIDRAGGAVRALLGAGAPANIVSKGKPALLWAMLGANAAAVRLLCAAGADTQALTEDGSRGLVMCLFGPLAPDGGTPRWSEAEYVEALRALAACGRDITRCSSEGRPFSPLCTAAACGRELVIKCLLAAGADVNDTTGNCYRATPLHFAVHAPSMYSGSGADEAQLVEKSLRCVRRLLRAGADTRARRFDGGLAVSAVLCVGDLRIADAIFAAEDASRGAEAAAAPADVPPEELERERALRAAVAEYRRTGDALVPASLRPTGLIAVGWTPQAPPAPHQVALDRELLAGGGTMEYGEAVSVTQVSQAATDGGVACDARGARAAHRVRGTALRCARLLRLRRGAQELPLPHGALLQVRTDGCDARMQPAVVTSALTGCPPAASASWRTGRATARRRDTRKACGREKQC